MPPLSPPLRLVQGFRAPTSAWGPGHRGIDYLVSDGQVVLSPVDGVVSFVGSVAGKAVVTVASPAGPGGGFRASVEPACTGLVVGDRVRAGQTIGQVCGSGYLSHCAPELCLHLSARTEAGYLSPQLLMGQLSPSRLVR